MLLGLAAAELLGVIYMFSAMSSVLSFFSPRRLVPDAMRVASATAATIGVGVVAVMLPTTWGTSERATALIKLMEVSLACLVTSWPAVALTKSISTEEQRTVLNLLIPWKRPAALGNE